MTKQELKQSLSNGEDIKIIDVREKDEYEAGNKIEGAENIPMGKVFVEAAQGVLPKDKKIITVCKSGARAGIVARELEAKGYDIDYLEGGMNEWENNNE